MTSRPHRTRAFRHAGALVGSGMFALLAACGGGGSSTATGNPTTNAAATASTVAGTPQTTRAASTSGAPTSSVAIASTTSSASPAPTGLLETSSSVEPEPGTTDALELLAAVVVANEHVGGYERSLFPHWLDLDRNGCSAREDVLIDESLTAAQVDPYGCKVIEGDWVSAYDGRETSTPSEFDIDHVVALKEAWDSGAWRWSTSARRAFANDLTDDRTLIAVSASSNRSKSDKDPSNWLPPISADLCRFLGDWVSVKVRWNLTMDQSEHGRIRNLLTDECPGLRVRMPSAPPVDLPDPSGPGDPGETTTTASGGGGGGDVYYANCTEARADGAAPILRGEPGYRSGLDRDGDGVACE